MLCLIPKTTGRRSFVDPIPAWGIDSGGYLFIRCGKCGQCLNLDEQHVVAPMPDQPGRAQVTPSLHHDVPECGWHVMGVLEGWDSGISFKVG